MKYRKCFLTGLMILFVNSCKFTSPFGAPKPIDYFSDMFNENGWDKLSIIYWVRVSENEREKRTFEIHDEARIKQLLDSIEVKEVRALSVGISNNLVFNNSKNSKKMSFDFVFSDCVDIQIGDDKSAVSVLELNNSCFYELLRMSCFENEHSTSPSVTKNHIILRENLALKSYPVLRRGE